MAPTSPIVDTIFKVARQTYEELDAAHELDGTFHESYQPSLIFSWTSDKHTRYIQANVLEDNDQYEVEVEWYIHENADRSHQWDHYVADLVPPHPLQVQRAIEQAYNEIQHHSNDLPYSSTRYARTG